MRWRRNSGRQQAGGAACAAVARPAPPLNRAVPRARACGNVGYESQAEAPPENLVVKRIPEPGQFLGGCWFIPNGCIGGV